MEASCAIKTTATDTDVQPGKTLKTLCKLSVIRAVNEGSLTVTERN